MRARIGSCAPPFPYRLSPNSGKTKGSHREAPPSERIRARGSQPLATPNPPGAWRADETSSPGSTARLLQCTLPTSAALAIAADASPTLGGLARLLGRTLERAGGNRQIPARRLAGRV